MAEDPSQSQNPKEVIFSSPSSIETNIKFEKSGKLDKTNPEQFHSDILSAPATTTASYSTLISHDEKVSIRFFQFFATLVFLTGTAVGVASPYISRTEVVRTIENGRETGRVEHTIPGDSLVQKAGFGMAGLAAGSIFFSYAPGFVQGALRVMGAAVVGAAAAAQKQDNSEKE